jgi:ketosteroid isomerase-like protein
MKYALLFALGLVVVAGCGGVAADADSLTATASQADALSASRHAELRQSLFAVDAFHSNLIANLGPVTGLMALIDDDATLLLAGHGVITGREAVQTALEAQYPAGTTFSVARTLAGGEIATDGGIGFTFGWVEQVATPAGGATAVTYGTYVSVWRKEGDQARVVAYSLRSYPLTHGAPRAGFPLLADGPGMVGARHPGSLKDHDETLLAVDAAFAALSVEQGFSVAFPTFAGDILLLTGGKDHYYLEGTAEITAWYAGGTPAEVLDWTPIIAGASHSGDLGYTIGNATDTYTFPDGKVTVGYSKYLTLWLRQADGSWRAIGDAGSTSPAPAN